MNTKTKRRATVTDIDPARHVKMMQTPDEWPAWPKLSLRKEDPSASPLPYVCGFLVDGRGPVVFTGNVFQITDVSHHKLNALQQKRYATFNDMYMDGWRVD